MALREMIRREVQKALSIGGPLQDIPVRVLYFPASSVAPFDPLSQDTSAESPPKSVEVVFVGYKAEEIDGVNILPEDKQAYMADLNRVKEGIPVPLVDDRLQESNGSLWKVVVSTTDPASACFVLQVRNP